MALYGQFLMPYPQYSLVQSAGKQYGESTYHALVTQFKKRFGGNSSINLAYTWAHLITNSDSENGFLEPGEGQTGFNPQDYDNPRADRSNSSADVRQRLTFEYLLDLPFGKGRKLFSNAGAVMNQAIGGWSLSGITSLQTGLPIGLTTAAGDLASSEFGAGTIRPNVVPGVSKKASGSRFQRTLPGNAWFNPAAFAAPAASSFGFGNEGRLDSTLRQDATNNSDLGLGKTFKITERFALQFHAEYFNIFNRPQFVLNSANGQIGAAGGVGVITAISNTPRAGQFSLRLTY